MTWVVAAGWAIVSVSPVLFCWAVWEWRRDWLRRDKE